MNANCVICSDLFTPSDHISTTRCGHIFHHVCLLQWIERSQTCPQCRKSATQTTVIKTYFNFTNSEGITLDAGALQNKLDSAEFNLKQKEKEFAKLKEETLALEKTLEKTLQKNISLECTDKEKNGTIKMMKEHIEYLKTDSKEVSQLRSENNRLKDKVDTLKSLQEIIDGTKSEVEAMVQNMPDINKLSTYIVILKKSVINSESKKKSLQEAMRILQNKLQKMESERTDLISKVKLLESSVNFLEEQNKDRCIPTSSNNPIDDKTVICDKTIDDAKFINQNEMNDLSENNKILLIKSTAQKLIDKSENQKNSSSPYLTLKQSNNLFTKLQTKSQHEVASKSKLHNFYILKDNKNCDKFDKIKNGQMFNKMAQKRKQLETVYDGLGGHFKPDVFPGTSNVKNIDNTSSMNILKKTKTFK